MKITDKSHPRIAFTAQVMTLLDPTNNRSRVAFGASCAERLWRFYDAFSIGSRWGNSGCLKNAIAELWHVASDQTTAHSFDDPMDLLEIGPRSGEHSSPLTFAAQYAVSCVIHARLSVAAETSDEAAWCSIVNRDCIYEYLEFLAATRMLQR